MSKLKLCSLILIGTINLTTLAADSGNRHGATGETITPPKRERLRQIITEDSETKDAFATTLDFDSTNERPTIERDPSDDMLDLAYDGCGECLPAAAWSTCLNAQRAGISTKACARTTGRSCLSAASTVWHKAICGEAKVYDNIHKFLADHVAVRRTLDLSMQLTISMLVNYYFEPLVLSSFATDNTAKSVCRNLRETFPKLTGLHRFMIYAGATTVVAFTMPVTDFGLAKMLALSAFREISDFWAELYKEDKQIIHKMSRTELEELIREKVDAQLENLRRRQRDASLEEIDAIV